MNFNVHTTLLDYIQKRYLCVYANNAGHSGNYVVTCDSTFGQTLLRHASVIMYTVRPGLGFFLICLLLYF